MHKISVLLGADTEFNMAQIYNPKVTTSGLILYLDAANRDSYPGSGTSWNDLSGRGHVGTLVNSPTFNTSALGSISFAGNTGHVTVPDSNDWSGSEFTMDVWFNRSATWPAAWWADALLSHDVGPGETSSKWIYSYDPAKSKPIFHINYAPNISVVIEPAGTVSVSTSRWYNFSITKLGTSFTFYSNGTSLGSATNSSLIPNAAAPLRIGTGEGSSPFFNGLVSTVRMYDRALSATEISSNFSALRSRYGV